MLLLGGGGGGNALVVTYLLISVGLKCCVYNMQTVNNTLYTVCVIYINYYVHLIVYCVTRKVKKLGKYVGNFK